MQARPLEQKIRGALLGVAVGDALGVPFEFCSRADIIERYGENPVTEMIGGGWSHARPGAVTDDTEMTVLLGQSLLDSGGHDPEAVVEAYLDWAGKGSPYVGRIIKSVLLKVNEGVPLEQAEALYHEESGGQSAGNGALMRISPLVICYLADPAAMDAAVARETLLTHHHPLAVEASRAYAAILAALLRGEDDPLELPFAVSAEVAEAVEASRAQAKRRIAAEGGFVLASLAASCAALSFASLEEALVWLVNQGGDADTHAACAGALLGARDGVDAIPERWLEALEVRDQVEQMASGLLAVTGW